MRLAALFLLSLFVLAPGVLARETSFHPNELLVILNADSPLVPAREGRLQVYDPGLASLLAQQGLDHQEAIVHKSGALDERDRRYLKLISSRPDFDPLAASEQLSATELFRAVSPNYEFSLLVLPNDTYRPQQWHIDTPNGADVHLPEAWDIERGDPGTIIAIVDTGVDWSHADLAGNCWHNPGEIAGNGIDDDLNGYIDDVYGWDCGENDNDPRPDSYVELGIEVGWHGTHCAGIASAVTNNGVGVAGAGWSCSLMGLKVTAGGNSFSTASVTQAFLYAIDEQADVISMSFGGTFTDFGFMQSLVNDATAAGIVCVAAAGNNNDSQMMYPAALNNVLSVGATNSANQRASFSTYGSWVDLAAPGEQIWSTISQNYDFGFLNELLFMLLYGYDGVNPYMYSDGTSMACPLAAGVCALVRSAAPSLSATAVAQRVIDTGDHVVYDQPLGVKINAFAAVNGLSLSATGDGPDHPASLLLHSFPNPFNPQTTLSFTLPVAGRVRLAVYDLDGRLVRSLCDQWRPAGRQAFVWDGRARTGHDSASGVYVARLESGGVVRSVELVMVR